MPEATAIHTSSSIDSANALGEQFWQVFFLPKDDPAVPTSFIAFCPFTGVCAEGATETEAGTKWKEEARKRFNHYFYLPELHTTRKVWYGESPAANQDLAQGDPTNANHVNQAHQGQGPQTSMLGFPLAPSPIQEPMHQPLNFYVIDNYSDTEQAVAFSPQSKTVIVGKGVEELSEVETLPHFWSDWRVSCTPLLHRNWFFSLTPHCINW